MCETGFFHFWPYVLKKSVMENFIFCAVLKAENNLVIYLIHGTLDAGNIWKIAYGNYEVFKRMEIYSPVSFAWKQGQVESFGTKY